VALRAVSVSSASNRAIISRVKGQCIDRGEHCFDLRRQPWGGFLGSSTPQFRSDDDASANFPFADDLDSFGYPTLRVSDQVRHDVGVEQEAHQMLTSSGGSSVRLPAGLFH
jgi:hypothetical protein